MTEQTLNELSQDEGESEPQELIDQHFVCATCGQDFMFTKNEQRFFKDKGLLHSPTHCNTCRQSRRERFEQNRTRQEVNNAQDTRTILN